MELSKILIILGLFLILAGIFVFLFPQVFKWIGDLPGDIHIKGEKSKIHIPIISMIVISIALTILLNGIFWIISRFK